MKHISATIKGIFYTIVYAFLGMIIPKHRKRLFLLTSLQHQLATKGAITEQSLTELNKTLHLSQDDTYCCKTSIEAIYEIVWDSEKIGKIVSDIPEMYDGKTCLLYKDANRLSEEILPLVPTWLRYGSLDAMKKDIISLFYCQPLKTV